MPEQIDQGLYHHQLSPGYQGRCDLICLPGCIPLGPKTALVANVRLAYGKEENRWTASSLLQGNRDLAEVAGKLHSRAGPLKGDPYALVIPELNTSKPVIGAGEIGDLPIPEDNPSSRLTDAPAATPRLKPDILNG